MMTSTREVRRGMVNDRSTALAFLRQAGLVEKHGQSGYSIPKAKTLAG